MKPINITVTIFQSTNKRIGVIVYFDVEKELNIIIDGGKKELASTDKMRRIIENDIATAVSKINIEE